MNVTAHNYDYNHFWYFNDVAVCATYQAISKPIITAGKGCTIAALTDKWYSSGECVCLRQTKV
jgi:hypothetical protein